MSNNGFFDEYLLAECKLRKVIPSTGIDLVDVQGNGQSKVVEIYDLRGIRQERLQRGVNIIRRSDGSVQKVLIK